MAEDTKDTIYIDVDDEITTVIDKVTGSSKKLVALVLPKRASVFQSIVNMKLLKRKADEAKKNLVLVTNDSGLLPLAGAVGIHVAKTLSSKPEIPAAPIIGAAMVEAAEDEIPSAQLEPDEPTEADEMKSEAQEEINKSANKAKAKESPKDVDTIELDNTDDDKAVDTAMPAVAAAEAKKKAKKNKDKSLKVPNFNKFRMIALLGGGGLLILIILFILLFKVFPHATVDIKTNAQNVDANLTFNMAASNAKLNTNSNTVPSKQVTETKTYTATVNATGQQNNGQKATGQATLSLTNCSQSSITIPAGAGISANNLTYITQSSVTLSSVVVGGKCNPSSFSSIWSGSTNITAQAGGSSYNVSNTSFTVPSFSDVSANGSANGGTDDNVTVVSQSDINSAENKIATDTSGAKTDLTNQLNQANFYPLSGTFVSASPTITPNANAGTAANSVTVTETVKYTMSGVVKNDLVELLNNNIKSQSNGNQSIINNGLSSATYTIGSNPNSVTLSTTAIVGPNINIADLKKEITGQKVGSIESIVKTNQDVSSVSVKLSPFYVSKAPSPSKITINIAKPTNNPNASNN